MNCIWTILLYVEKLLSYGTVAWAVSDLRYYASAPVARAEALSDAFV